MKLSLTLGQRRWITLFITLALAFLSGHLMQSDRAETRVELKSDVAIALPELPVVTANLTSPPGLGDRILATRAERKGGCDPHLELSETPAGLLNISLDAPCYARESFTLEVNALKATDTTDARGRWDLRLPALSEEVEVNVSIAGQTVSDRLLLQHAKGHQHVILAWSGAQTFHIRAEARTGETGRLASGDVSSDPPPIGAFTAVGNGVGASFEIFTFPLLSPGSGGVVRLSVDARVTQENCGKDVSTLAYQTGYLGTLRPTKIAYTMPACDRLGEVVRLQNLFRDLRLAGR